MTVITKLSGFEAIQVVPSLIVGSGSTYPVELRYTVSLEKNRTLRICRGHIAAEIAITKMQQLSVQHVALRKLYLDTRQLVSNSYQGLGSEMPQGIEFQIGRITNSAVLSRKIHFWLATLGLPVGCSFDEYNELVERSRNELRKRLWVGVRADTIPPELTESQKFVALTRFAALSEEVFTPNAHIVLRADVIDNQLNLFIMAAGMYTEYRLLVS